MKTKTTLMLVISVLAIFVLLSGCGPAAPTKTPTPAATQAGAAVPSAPAVPAKPTVPALPVLTPTATTEPVKPSAELSALLASTPQSLAPLVTGHRPDLGEEAALDAAVEVTFDQAMDDKATASAWSMTAPDGQPVQGQLTWANPQTLHFKPSQPLQPGSTYQVTISQQAASQGGVSLQAAVVFPVTTLTRLQVGQVFPHDAADQVQPGSQITVMFNRPVVALKVAEEQSGLVQPLTFTPPVSGKGQWVNTSVYLFKPDPPLLTGTSYQVSIAGGLKDSTGSPASALADAFKWQFTTLPPQIAQVDIGTDTIYMDQLYAPENISQNPAISITFRQPMDQAATANAVLLVGEPAQKVPFKTRWEADGKKLIIAPSTMLTLGKGYLLALGAGAKAADGGPLGSQLDFNFFTIPAPAVLYAGPDNNDLKAGSLQFVIDFASPMDIKTINERVSFTPPIENQDKSWYYDQRNKRIMYYGFQASTKYTVNLKAGMLDIFGNAINKGTSVTFTTRSLEPSVSLDMPYIALYRQGGPQDFYVRYTNIKSVDFKLYRLSTEAYISYMGKGFNLDQYQPNEKDLVWKGQEVSTAKLNEQVVKAVRLNGKNGPSLAPGFYFLGMDNREVTHKGLFLDGHLLFISSANLTFKSSNSDGLLWLTDLASGAPVADQPLKVVDSSASTVAEGKTDADGLFKFDLPNIPKDVQIPNYYAITTDDNNFAFTSGGWYSGVSPEDFGLWSQYYGLPSQATAYLYTDRPLYRPGQPVYFKGIVRLDNDMAYRIPSQKEVEAVITSYDGTEIYRQKLPLSGYGSFNGTLNLDKGAALGGYSIEVHFSDSKTSIGYLSFTVAEYRKPEFVVDVSTAQADVLGGQKFDATVSAQYYSGGALAGAEVQWSLTSDPYLFTPPDSSNLGNYSFYDDTGDELPDSQRSSGSRSVAEGTGVTDENGKLVLSLPAEAQVKDATRRLTLGVTVTDIAGSAVSGQAVVTSHRSEVYVGVKPEQYVSTAGKETAFDVATVDWKGKPVTKQALGVTISQRNWYSVQEQDAQGVLRWVTSVKDTPVATIMDVVTDDQGLAKIPFTPDKGGTYRIRVTAQDKSLNTSSATAYLWVSGREYVAWQQSNDRSFKLVADKDSYKPGDNAQVLIASPFQGDAYALVTVERGLIRKEQVLKLSGNSTLYSLPVTGDMAPVVYVSVLVVKGIDSDNPRPSYKIGMASLNVSTDEQQVKVEVTPDKKAAGPGDKVTYNVKTTLKNGSPVEAEVSLSLSDLAVLALMDPNSGPVLDYFYSKRALEVRTAVGLVFSVEDYNALMAQRLSEGKGMGSGGGGEKGGGFPGVPEVRQNFPDTAFWKADVLTGADGTASVVVTLPDNLTTWRMDARAVTVDTRVGQTTVDIISSKPLLVRPQTPRFFVAGDQAAIGTAVHNNTGQDMKVDVKLDAAGLTLSDPATQTVSISNGQIAYVSWKVKVPEGSTRVDLVFSAVGGSYQDASRPTLGTLDNQGIPVYRYESPETVSTSGELTAAGARGEAIALPETMKVSQGTLTVKVEPSLAAGMTAGLAYLEHYPYECIEQTVSAFLPNVLTTQAMQAAGVSNPQLEANLKEQVGTALQRLSNLQNSDGGWGWWGGSSSQPLTSAYAVLGLVEAQKAGYTITQNVLDRALVYLHKQAVPSTKYTPDYTTGGNNRQAFILYVLARAGEPEVSATVQLYDGWQSLAVYARAFLARALYAIRPSDPRINNLLGSLVDTAFLSASGAQWQEPKPDYWNWSTDTRTTAIVLDTLIQLDPKNSINANAVRWLMRNRVKGRWESTQETAWSLMALTDWMNTSGEMKASYTYAVQLNGKTLGVGKASPDTLTQTQTLQASVADLLVGQTNRLVFARDAGPGNLYYTADLNVYLPVPQIKALNQGVIISRRYFSLKDDKTPITQAAQGDLVIGQLTLIVPKDMNYLVVEDPLPAGLEAVDASLKTSPDNTPPDSYDWSKIGPLGWGWWYFTHTELRDEKLVLSTDYLPAGTYVYTYMARASTPGTFQVIPPTAQEFYFPEVYGRGEGSLFEVK